MGEGSRPGFWQTAPGVLAAFAAVITAVGGVLALLLQLGVIGATGQPAAGVTGPPGQHSTAPEVSGLPGAQRRPWSDVDARWTPKDGDAFVTRAETVRACISSGDHVKLDDGPAVLFRDMATFEVLRSDVAQISGGRAKVRITTLEGKTYDGTITSNCDFFGFDGTVRYSLFPDKLVMIEFLW